MFVNKIQNDNNILFKRKPTTSEMKQYTETILEGLKVLDKEMGIIIHNSSTPSLIKNNIGIGSLLSNFAQKSFIPFLISQGFSKIQQDPDMLRSSTEPSPYSPQSNSKNIYMIPLENLATSEYNYLLTPKDIQSLINKNQMRINPNKVNYTKINKQYNKTLLKAYQNLFINKTQNASLLNEFQEFKTKYYQELEPNAIYEILFKKNKNKNWKSWNNEEKLLYVNSNQSLLKKLRQNHKDDIDFHCFKQWLVNKELNKNNNSTNIKILGDCPVAWTSVEEWMHQDLFIENWALGCEPDNFSKKGQRWDFPVLNPNTIFNSDGSLGEGGKLLQKRYEKMFKSTSGGLRIDHIIGLIDPFVYKTNKPDMKGNNAGRLYSSPEHPILGKYAKNTDKEYSEIIEKIIIPTAKKCGIKIENIICEDLGKKTEQTIRTMNSLNLTGIAITQDNYIGKDTPPQNVIMLGSHDNESLLEYVKKIFKNKLLLDKKSKQLAKDTITPKENINDYYHKICTNKQDFILAFFTELFTSPAKQVQIFFTSFLGMDKTYNKPGTRKNCWKLRVPEDYEKLYWDNVKKGIAPNFPEIISRAIRNKGSDFAKKQQNLLAKLDEFTKILKN